MSLGRTWDRYRNVDGSGDEGYSYLAVKRWTPVCCCWWKVNQWLWALCCWRHPSVQSEAIFTASQVESVGECDFIMNSQSVAASPHHKLYAGYNNISSGNKLRETPRRRGRQMKSVTEELVSNSLVVSRYFCCFAWNNNNRATKSRSSCSLGSILYIFAWNEDSFDDWWSVSDRGKKWRDHQVVSALVAFHRWRGRLKCTREAFY